MTSLAALSEAAEGLRPTFIVGAARSGTSFFYRNLLAQPDFSVTVPHQGDLLRESKLFRHLPAMERFGGEEPYDLWSFMARDEERYRTFCEAIAPHAAAFAGLKRRTTPTTKAAGFFVAEWDAVPVADVVRAYFGLAREARGCVRLVEKTPQHIFYADELVKAFPDCRMIYMRRHPVDVYASYVKREGLARRGRWGSVSPDAFAAIYRTQFEHVAGAAQRWPDHLLVIAYEDFVTEPHACLERVSAFVDVEIDPERVGREDAEAMASFTRNPVLFGEIVERTKQWDDFLTEEIAADLERSLDDIMVAWEYPSRLGS
jgi:hypothetical protein